MPTRMKRDDRGRKARRDVAMRRLDLNDPPDATIAHAFGATASASATAPAARTLPPDLRAAIDAALAARKGTPT